MEKPILNWPIIGHDLIIQYFQNAVLNNRLHHAYLFTGLKNLGKRTLAEYLAHSLVCTSSKPDKPCGECSQCLQAARGIHPDIYRLSLLKNEEGDFLKKNISIEQVKDLQRHLQHHSFFNSYKIAILDDADYLSESAANAFLKTLEEPSGKALLILIADDSDNLPTTIVSRCQVIKFFSVKNDLIVKHLMERSIEKRESEKYAQLSCGRPGLAVNFATVKDFFNEYSKTAEVIVDIFNVPLTERFKIADDLISNKEHDFFGKQNNLNFLINTWIMITRDCLLLKESLPYLVAHSFLKDKLTLIAGRHSRDKLLILIDKLQEIKKYLAVNINPKLALDNLMIDI